MNDTNSARFMAFVLTLLSVSCTQESFSVNNLLLPEQTIARNHISGVALIHGYVAIVADEAVGDEENKNYIQLLQFSSDGIGVLKRDILLVAYEGHPPGEYDIEGLSASDQTLYAIGSHSAKRPKIKESESHVENLRFLRFDSIEQQPSRDILFRLDIDQSGELLSMKSKSLREILEGNELLNGYSELPGKENGIDIEAIAVSDNVLYLGFRSPVFRHGYVPVLKVDYDETESSELIFVNLGGHSIRGMTAVSDGFLIIGGPTGEHDSSYSLFHWNGLDSIPGKGKPEKSLGKVVQLKDFVLEAGVKMEGIDVFAESEKMYQLVIAHDGANSLEGGLKIYHVLKVGSDSLIESDLSVADRRQAGH
jgi:hypothetical protein